MAEEQALLDAVFVGGVNGAGAAQAATALGALGLAEVAAAGAGAQYLAAGRNLKPLGRGLPSLGAFGTSHKSSTFFPKERAI